jgi:prophage DNA circulation protein
LIAASTYPYADIGNLVESGGRPIRLQINYLIIGGDVETVLAVDGTLGL